MMPLATLLEQSQLWVAEQCFCLGAPVTGATDCACQLIHMRTCGVCVFELQRFS